jgi:hypothetical protein
MGMSLKKIGYVDLMNIADPDGIADDDELILLDVGRMLTSR